MLSEFWNQFFRSYWIIPHFTVYHHKIGGILKFYEDIKRLILWMPPPPRKKFIQYCIMFIHNFKIVGFTLFIFCLRWYKYNDPSCVHHYNSFILACSRVWLQTLQVQHSKAKILATDVMLYFIYPFHYALALLHTVIYDSPVFYSTNYFLYL